MNLGEWRDRWTAAGFPVIPLWPGSKVATCESWQLLPPAAQWEQTSHVRYPNIGARAGNGTMMIDADSSPTAARVRAGLEARGLHWPEVATRRGTHFYGRCSDVPAGFNYGLLDNEVGPGEWRARHSYVVAPCSQVNGHRYRFRIGSPEAVARLAPIRWRDLEWLIGTRQAVTFELEALPVRLLRRPMADRTRELLQALANTNGPTKPFGHYASRSEAEAAVIAGLILAGWTFEQVAELFDAVQPGHYAEHAHRDYYLARTYRKTLNYLASTPERQAAAAAYQAVDAAQWPGRGGALEHAVLLGLLAIGWQWNTTVAEAAVRSLAEHTAAGKSGVHNALGRLQEAGLIRQVRGWQVHADRREAKANAYEICPLIVQTESEPETDFAQRVDNSHSIEPLLETPPVDIVSTYCAFEVQEVWARARLGRSAGLVYGHLGPDEIGVSALAEATGKHRNTVRKALHRLAERGLAEQAGRQWIRGPADLAAVARDLDAEGHAKRRRHRHDLQRVAWWEHVERWQNGTHPRADA